MAIPDPGPPQFPFQPRAGEGPLSLDSRVGNGQRFRRLLDGEARERSQLDDLRVSRLDGPQSGEGFVQNQKVRELARLGDMRVIQGDLDSAAAALGGLSAP